MFGLGKLGRGYGRMGSGGGSLGPRIVLSASTISEDAALNTVIGTLSVINGGAATWTFTVSADPDAKFDIADDVDVINDATVDYETATSHSVTILATPDVGDAISRQFTITVTNVAPVLSSVSGVATAATTADLFFTTTEGNGDLSWVITQSTTQPTSAQIKAGLNHLGAAAVDAGVIAVAAAGAQTDSATGLTNGQSYYVHAIHEDDSASDSVIETSAQWTQAANPIVANQTISFGALTLTDSGDCRIVNTGGACTSWTIDSGDSSPVHFTTFVQNDQPYIRVSAEGNADNLNEGPYTLGCTFQPGGDTATITVNIVANAYSVAPGEVDAALDNIISTAPGATRLVMAREGETYTTDFGVSAGTLKDRAFTHRVTLRGTHDNTLVAVDDDDVAECTQPIEINNVDNFTLEKWEVHVTSTTSSGIRMVRATNGCTEILVNDVFAHGTFRDPNGEYTYWQEYENPEGIVLAGNNVRITGCRVEDAWSGFSTFGATGDLVEISDCAGRRLAADFINVGHNGSASPTQTLVKRSYCTEFVGSASDDSSLGGDPDSGPHSDGIQIRLESSATADYTGLVIEQFVCSKGNARGTPQGIFFNCNNATHNLKDFKINACGLYLNGTLHGISLDAIDGGEIYGCDVVEWDPTFSEGSFPDLVPGISVGTGSPGNRSTGTVTVRGNKTCFISHGGSGTLDESENLELGTHGDEINPDPLTAYADVFDGPTFAPDTRAELLTKFSTRANGPGDADDSGDASAGDIGLIGTGYATFGDLYTSSGWTVDSDDGSYWDATLVSVSPADNATDVAIDTDIVITWSEAVLSGSGTFSLKLTSDDSTVDSWTTPTDAGSGAGQYEISGAAATFHLTTELDNGEEYYIVWTAGAVTDADGNPVAAQASTTAYSFTTVAVAGYTANAVHFDAGTHLERDGALTSGADTKVGLISFWLKMSGADGTFFRIFDNNGNRCFINRGSSNLINITLKDSAGTTALDMDSANTVTQSDGWVHVLAAWNVATGVAQMYIDDATDREASPTIADLAVDWTRTETLIGATAVLGNKLDGDIADLYINIAETLDLDVEANRRKFIDAGGKPVDLGADGSTPTGNDPIIFLSGATATWHTNDGYGGGFTETSGDITTASTSPSD